MYGIYEPLGYASALHSRQLQSAVAELGAQSATLLMRAGRSAWRHARRSRVRLIARLDRRTERAGTPCACVCRCAN